MNGKVGCRLNIRFLSSFSGAPCGLSQFSRSSTRCFAAAAIAWTRPSSQGSCPGDHGNGKVSNVVSQSIDLTDIKRAEEALRESEERMRAIGDNLPAGQIFQLMVQPDGTSRFTYVSSAVERLHECTAEQVMADPSLLFSRVVEEDREGLGLATEKSIREMSDYDCEVRIRRKSGKIRVHRMISRPRLMPGNVIVFDGIDMDITERKRAEDALRESEERYQNLADATFDRLVHNALKINLKGESMRKINSSLTKSNNSGK